MSRPKKKPDYNPDNLMQQLLAEITEAYFISVENNQADGNGRLHLKQLAEEFSMTPIKIRKLLITAGIYETATSKRVMELKEQGRTIKEIMQITSLSAASVSGYLPYQKTIYKMSEVSILAERLRLYRSRKNSVEKLKTALEEGIAIEKIKVILWEAMELFEGYVFYTSQELRYNYKVKGNEIFFSRKEKSVTRETVELALEEVLRLQEDGVVITGPKKLGCFGASYIYPVFVRFGLIKEQNC
ncbi:MAG: hypothetical protein J6K04_07060 [Lachnospiraceae bacterium]|nr:hypothetical protein [Lachnospiraceae bacterium]